MRDIDITSERDISELVTDGLQSAALAAIANLESAGLAIYGAGIVNSERRADFAAEVARGNEAVRDAAADLVDTLAATGETWAVEHTVCDSFARECGEALTVLAAKLGRLTDEYERGWIYGDNLVRTLAAFTLAVDNLAESVTTEREATDKGVREVTIYLASVPAELAGMVAV